jgi:hypothetical protein
MSTKKPLKKAPVKKNAMEMKAKAFAKDLESESKELGSKIWVRWELSSTEEKLFTILGIILLILGLYVLRNMIGGMLLIVLGILFVTGFFLKRKK